MKIKLICLDIDGNLTMNGVPYPKAVDTVKKLANRYEIAYVPIPHQKRRFR